MFFNYELNDFSGAKTDYSEDYITTGVRIAFSIMNGGDSINKIKVSRKEYDISEIELEAAIEDVEDGITSLFLDIKSSQEAYNSTYQSILDNKMLYNLLRKSELMGFNDTYRLTTVQNKLNDLQIDLIDKRFQFLKRYIKLKKNAGILNDKYLNTIEGYFTLPEVSKKK